MVLLLTSRIQNKRSKMCGNAIFLKLQKLKEDHVRQGHYYLEYLKFACEPNCESCKQEGWSRGVPGNWFPVPGLSDTRREGKQR